MFRRVELHNHTTESDCNMRVEELVAYAMEQGYETLAITDHNTVTGHHRARQAAAGTELAILPGIEVTTFFGHILCLNCHRYIDWTEIDPKHPDAFLAQCRKNGALVGIAHPFCINRPIVAGCRWEMDIHDYSQINYIEVINGGSGLSADALFKNDQAIQWWMDLVFSGYSIAAVTGLDLHSKTVSGNLFSTFVQLDESHPTDPVPAVLRAIREGRTVVSRGPILYSITSEDRRITLGLDDTRRFNHWEETCVRPLTVTVRLDNGQDISSEFKPGLQLTIPSEAHCAIPILYHGEPAYNNLLAISYPIRF